MRLMIKFRPTCPGHPPSPAGQARRGLSGHLAFGRPDIHQDTAGAFGGQGCHFRQSKPVRSADI